jgi:MinD superfamily P-loop ATPase
MDETQVSGQASRPNLSPAEIPSPSNAPSSLSIKELVILSGKGGTGKTSVTAALAHLAGQAPAPGGRPGALRVVLADADVDASNLELVLDPKRLERHTFEGGQVAIIDPAACQACDICAQVCRFDAVTTYSDSDVPIIDTFACDGCAACVYQCPSEAIHMQRHMAGEWFYSTSRYGPVFHAALRPGEDNSGKLVMQIKSAARDLARREKYDLIIVDGPPGIGCPVISAASGADLALMVTEPTAAGAHDLARVLDTVHHFDLPALVCINKIDLHPAGAAAIESLCDERGVEIVGRIPFDLLVTRSMVNGVPVTTQGDNPVNQELERLWERVTTTLMELG